jgi:hypothetical protein
MLAAALALLALSAPRTVAAQGTPEQVATQYLQSMKTQDFAANAALVHPAEEDSLKAALLEAISGDTSTAGLRQVFNVGSVAEFRALPAQTVYQRFVSATITQQEGMVQALGAATFSVMGHVDGGDTAYVVYRVSANVNGNALSQVSVLSLRRDGAAWKVRLPEDLKQTIAGLRTAAAQRRAVQSALQSAGQAPPAQTPAPPRPPAPAAPPPAPARP